MDSHRHEERQRCIREMAHRICEEEGHPQGQDKRHWDMAETLIRAGQNEWMESAASPDCAAFVDVAGGTKDQPKACPDRSTVALRPHRRSRTAATRRK